MSEPKHPVSHFQSRINKSTHTLFYWVLAWLLASALLAFGPKFLWDEMRAVTLGVVAVNVVIGIGMILANKNHIQTLDELHRRVLLDAMGITLGVVVVVGVPYALLEAYEVIAFEGETAALYVIMSITYMASVFLGLRRYR